MTSQRSGSWSDEPLNYDYVVDTEEEHQLSWRLDPEQSHSDWTIVIEHADSGKADTYHVHKNILAVGPWKSDYFAGLFRSTQMAESQHSTSRIILEDLAAKAMPLLLDFMYDPKHQTDISTEHAVALRYLSKYFGVRSLYKRVMEYHKQDMNLQNLGTYVSHARLFHDETVLSLAASMCVDNLSKVDETMLEAVDPTFLLRILSSPDVDTCSYSYQLSKIVSQYCRIHQDTLDMDTFLQLTDRKYTPLIDRDAALPLLEAEASLQQREESVLEKEKATHKQEPPTVARTVVDKAQDGLSKESAVESTTTPDSSSCLQNRCIHRLSLSWSDFADPVRIPPSSLEQLSPRVLATLLEQSCRAAKEDYDKIKEDWRRDVTKLRLDQENMVCGAIESEINLKHQAERIQRESQEKIAHLRSLLAERDRQIRMYQKEWDKMVRVPAEHSFTNDALCTFHHLSGNEPFDHQRSVNRFGRVRPTSMPKIGSFSENGFLVVEQEGNNTYKRWPVFYYKGV